MGSSILTRGISPGTCVSLVSPLALPQRRELPVDIGVWVSDFNVLLNKWSTIQGRFSSLVSKRETPYRELNRSIEEVTAFQKEVLNLRGITEGADLDLYSPYFTVEDSVRRWAWYKDFSLSIGELLVSTGNTLDTLESLSATEEFSYHVVRDWDTLHSLASDLLGSSSDWRTISNVNGIDISNFPDAYVGKSIKIPRR